MANTSKVSGLKIVVFGNKLSSEMMKRGLDEKNLGQAAVSAADTWKGVDYLWGGKTRRGVDCSGLTKNVWIEYGVVMPNGAANQYSVLKTAGYIDSTNAQPGDLIFFKRTVDGKSQIYHAGVYAGHGKFIHAPRPGKKVQEEDLEGYWAPRLAGYGRVTKFLKEKGHLPKTQGKL